MDLGAVSSDIEHDTFVLRLTRRGMDEYRNQQHADGERGFHLACPRTFLSRWVEESERGHIDECTRRKRVVRRSDRTQLGSIGNMLPIFTNRHDACHRTEPECETLHIGSFNRHNRPDD